MSSRLVSALGLMALLASCKELPVADPVKKKPDPVAVVDGAPPPIETSRYEQALAEVKRLRALADQDPLLAPWTGIHGGVPPWDQVSIDKFSPAFTIGLALLAAEIDVIAENPEPASFDNTFVPLEDAGRYQGRAETLFSVMTSNLKTPEVEAVELEWQPKLSLAYDAITFNDKLFARISAIHAEDKAHAEQEQLDEGTMGLSPERSRLVKLTYDRFVQGGAQLSPDQKAEVGRINEELATLFSQFSNKVLADENTWIVLASDADLAGLPADLRASYKAAADERKVVAKGVVVNTRSSVDPFLAASSNRALREQVWKAFKNRGDSGGATDTNATIARIVALRAERARLLGYPSHAHWRMANTMAVDPAKAEELMMRVWPAAVKRVGEEVADMAKIARKEKAKITIEPWDFLYYGEKVRKQKYALEEEQLKPYFELDNMIKGSMWMAEQLYGLVFTEITGQVPVFHPDVRVWEVNDKATGNYVGLFYGDYFARAGKRSGAWASGYQGHETFTGTVITPITSNNNNFVRGAKDAPVLISLDDAETLFHEFGHALHSLLSEVNFPGLASTPRDFVEYPSQVHEMWVLSKPVLDKFGRHYKTGKTMPKALLKKIEKSRHFNQGYGTVEYLSSAIVDMAMHTIPDGKLDPDAFERDTLARIGAPKEVAMRHRLPHFLHLFSSDSYSAGYYSYLWSEVMDADTRQAFAEAGDVFDKATAEKLRRHILAPGNSTDRTEAYRRFRGRDPDIEALLRKRGFPVDK